MDPHFDNLQRMYHRAPVNQVVMNKLIVREGETELTWKVDPQFFHAGDSLHGSLYFKLIDDAAYFAAQSREREVFLLTGTFNVQFLRPVTGGELIAHGKVQSVGETWIEAQAILRDAEGKLCGKGTGKFARSAKRLADTDGYLR